MTEEKFTKLTVNIFTLRIIDLVVHLGCRSSY